MSAYLEQYSDPPPDPAAVLKRAAELLKRFLRNTGVF